MADLENKSSSSSRSKSSAMINPDGTQTRESEATVSIDDGMGNIETTSVSLSDSNKPGEDPKDPTDTMNDSGGETTDNNGTDATETITELTNTAPSEDISEVRRTESSQQQSLISGSFINNGSFEGDSFSSDDDKGNFNNWRTIGDTKIETKEIGIAPTDGESQALITNGFSHSGGSVEESDLSEFLDLTSGSLDALLEGNATEGSGIKQSFTAQAGDILEFDYRLLTNEATPSATFNDSAIFALGTSVGNFALELGDTSDPTFSVNNGDDDKPVEGFQEATDGKTIRIAISEAGTYELGFGIVDLTDSIIDSGILLDDVKLTSTGVGAFSSPSVDASVENQTDGTISSEVDFTFTTNGFAPTNGSSNPQQ
ncbi:MAG: hypothetical protein WBA39_02580 [Rivularia sp. (in: cyanobacteria)]